MKRLELILNGKSAGSAQVRHAVQRLRAEGHNVNVHVTWESGDAERFAAHFAADSEVVVVAGGGDGTVNEVLNGLFATGHCACALAVLPLGTANDFANSATIPVTDAYLALLLAAQTPPQAVDVGVMNGRCFLNVASGGFGAEVTAQTPIALKNALGGSAYALQALLMSLGSCANKGRLVTPDRTYEGSVLMFAVGNGRQAGGGAQMTPQALIDDAQLDVMLVPDHADSNFVQVLQNLSKLMRNETQGFYHLRVPRLRIEAERELQVNLDGEPLRAKVFSFHLLAQALRLVLPAHCPLLTTGGKL